MTLLGATSPGQSGAGSNGNERLLQILQVSPPDGLMSYQDTRSGGLTPLQRRSWCILQAQPAGLESFEG